MIYIFNFKTIDSLQLLVDSSADDSSATLSIKPIKVEMIFYPERRYTFAMIEYQKTMRYMKQANAKFQNSSGPMMPDILFIRR